MSTKGITGKEPDPRIVYADIIDLPHHESSTRPHMSLYNRAAQFSAFDALSGYSDMVEEEARLTDQKTELGEYELEVLSQKLNLLSEKIGVGYNPEITASFFVPDERKAGGSYQEYTGTVKRIDPIERKLVFFSSNGHTDGKQIGLDQVMELHGEFLDQIGVGIETP